MTGTEKTFHGRRSDGAAEIAGLEKSRLYSEALGIDLEAGGERACFLWFLASLLYGARISGTIAEHTYQAFVQHDLTSPDKIIAAGRDYLINPVMRAGGYVRYDESKSRQIQRNCQRLLNDYNGQVSEIEKQAEDSQDLEARIGAFYGVGRITTNIFLRELRPYWPKADPDPLPIVNKTATQYGIDLSAHDRHSIAFTRLEAGLIRLAHRGPQSAPAAS